MKKFLIILTFFISTLFFIDNASALSYIEEIGETKYYIVHKWVGNTNNTGNDAYYVGIFNNMPTIENETIYDNENIIYYKILTKYNLLQFLNTGNTSYVDTITTTKNSMMLNSNSSYMMYANFNLYMNGSLYFAKKDYTPLSAPDNVENYYNVTSFYDNDISNYKYENYYILKSSLNNMIYDDITEWSATGNNYSSTSLNTIKNNLLNGNYDTYIENYGPYYITYNANAYNTNKICFFNNYNDIYLKRTHSDSNFSFKINLKNAYCFSYDRSSSSDLFSFNDELQPFTYMTTDVFNNIISLTGANDTIFYSDPDILKGLLGNDLTPSVNITKENQTTVTIENETYISSVTLNIEFSLIDNDKYFYLYKYGFDNDWSQIVLTQSNSISKTFNTNDTLYVQVMDQTTQETVSAATYTINNINYNFEPYVDFNETVPTACSFYKNGRSYTICKELNIIAKNLQDGNYIASYSYNKTDWTDFVNTTISLNENTTIYFQIVNYLTNEVSYRSTYTVGNIDTDISDLGVFNTYSSTYDKDTSFITAYINIYNLLEPVQDNYKIYYSTNSTSFTDITLLLNDMTNYYQFEINNINENKTIYFKITDLNDNILYTSTYTINYQVQATENSNFFTDFRTNFHGLSDIISTPLYAIKKLNKGVCSPLEIPIPYTNKSISLPCMTTVYQNSMPEILNIWQIVTNGLISYYIILDLFRIVKSFKEPEEDKIEVVNL